MRTEKGFLKKRISLMLTVCMFTCMLSSAVTALNVKAQVLDIGAGEAVAIKHENLSGDRAPSQSESVMITINSPFELMEFADRAAMDSYSYGKCFVLTQDIDMSAYSFKSIPVFSGTFDGRGHTISGLKYGGDGYVGGLFRYINESGKVQDLNVSGDIDSGENGEGTGGICGINYGEISGCTFKGSVSGKTSTGGIAAINEASGKIHGCTNNGQITGYYFTGGIAGKNYGIISYSYNKGQVNTTEEWVEGTDAMEPDNNIVTDVINHDVKGLMDTSVQMNSGVDSGGIAGFSRGGIYQCKNTADIGFNHVGYNVGGIAGRQAGIVSFCTNAGNIYGRKDIGGIVGQMEPYLTLSEMENLPDAVDRLHDLVDVTINDMDASVSQISGDVDTLSSYADNAVTAGNDLGRSAESYLNSTSDTVNNALSKVEYLSDQVPEVMNYMSRVGTNLNDMSKNVDTMLKDVNFYNRMSASQNDAESIREDLNSLSRNTVSMNEKIKKAVESEDPDEIIEKLADAMSSATDIAVSVNEVTQTVRPYVRSSLESVSGNSSKVTESMSQTANSLKEGMDKTRSIFDHVNSMSDINMPHLGSDFDVARDSLASNLSGMADILSVISSHSDMSSEQLTSDFADVNDQINTVFHLISDELEGLGNLANESPDDLVKDISEEDLESVTAGRVDHSSNSGCVEGDINIGGIAGAMAIDTDDPEENAAGDMTGGFRARYLLRNAVIGCKNDSNIESKKDGVGGIAGYMEQGIIKGCESYGSVCSLEGSYVGGIAGESYSVIKSSYAMPYLSGESYVGGIAGFGTTLTGCCCIPNIEGKGRGYGAIAGKIDTDKDTLEAHMEAVSGNAFVADGISGIDNMSVEGRAYPVTYDRLLSMPDTPNAFRNVRVIFTVDDERVGSCDLPYGTNAADIKYPEVSVSGDQYVEWQYMDTGDITSTVLIKGVKTDMQKTLESVTKISGEDKPVALISGSFRQGEEFDASYAEGRNDITYKVSYSGDNAGSVQALRLYCPYDSYVVYAGSKDDQKKVDSVKKGSYAEIRDGHLSDQYVIKNNSLVDKIKDQFMGTKKEASQ